MIGRAEIANITPTFPDVFLKKLFFILIINCALNVFVFGKRLSKIL